MTDTDGNSGTLGVIEERFEYGDGLVAYQRPCPGCDKGLLLRPARFHGECGGTGFLVRWENRPS